MEKINHFSHEEHPLILKKLLVDKNAIDYVVCYGCQQAILNGSSSYCCRECDNVFLHKSCAELPLEITHPMHSQHPLRLHKKPTYQLEICGCDICGREWHDFTYHCSECNFNVDVFCAKLEIFKYTIDRMHPLILVKESQQDMMMRMINSKKAILCYICHEELIVTGSSSYSYCCCECDDVFLHNSCAELLLEITHPMHSQHPLQLFTKPPSTSKTCKCGICGRGWRDFTYHCSKCVFDVDVICAKLEIFKHTIDGKHPLIPIKELQQDMTMVMISNEKFIVCYICGEELLASVGSSSTYFCILCEVFVHKSCGELPSEIMHPMHNSDCHHTLKLFARSGRDLTCNICYHISVKNGAVYGCYKCEFYLDVLCAQNDGKLVKHPSHQHPLKLHPRSALFICDACGTQDKDESYSCTVCSFWIHKSCGSLSSNSLYKCSHLATLVVAYSFPEQFRHYNLRCDICKKKFYPNYWLLYCGPCRYFVHIKCTTSKTQKDEAAKANSADEMPPNSISLPADVISSHLIQHYLKENGLPVLIEQPNEINHLSHKHSLILTNIQDDHFEMDDDDQETVCSGCAEPISGSCYACVQCNYLIHLHCAQLPNNLSSSYHPQHQLSLNYCREDFFSYFDCSCCRWRCNGFFYECKLCGLKLDINCALLPPIIKHEAHEHLLIRGNHNHKLCNACNSIHFDIFFSCKTCNDYDLSMSCVTCPRTVRHRWDKHPLTLSIPPFYYHPGEFICDICEEEAHPKYWLYHCRECDNSFHLKCIPRLGNGRKMKFGGKLQIDDEYHPHPLTFVREVKYNFRCNKCHYGLKGLIGFECEVCYFNLCWPCAEEIVDISSKKSN